MEEPIERIKWLKGEYRAKQDQHTLMEWEKGRITTPTAMAKIMKSNKIEELSLEGFIANAKYLGYERILSWEEMDD